MRMSDYDEKFLAKTTSLCPVHLGRIDALIIEQGDEVFVEKAWEGHG